MDRSCELGEVTVGGGTDVGARAALCRGRTVWHVNLSARPGVSGRSSGVSRKGGRMARFITPSTLGCVILATAACGSSLSEIRLPPPESQELTVEVRNDNHSAITVYAYRSGFRDRIGFVEAANIQTFTFKWPADEDPWRRCAGGSGPPRARAWRSASR